MFTNTGTISALNGLEISISGNIAVIDNKESAGNIILSANNLVNITSPFCNANNFTADVVITDSLLVNSVGGSVVTNISNITQMYAGRVNSDGTAASLPSGWVPSVNNTTNVYTITHGLGTTNYTVVGTSADFGVNDASFNLKAIDANFFQYVLGTDGGSTTERPAHFSLFVNA